MTIYESGREYKGNLHMHTTGSDGNLSPMDALRRYEGMGYDFLAVTDHRNVTKVPEYKGKMLILPGLEMDETLDREVVHLIGIGVSEQIREMAAPGLHAQAYIDAVKACGGLAFLAHPCWSLNRLKTLLGLKGLSGAEIYNSVSRPPFNPDRADATAILDLAALEGVRFNTIATDDSHWYEGEEGMSFIILRADSLTRENVMGALARGDYYASQGPRFESVRVEGGLVTVTCSPVSQILFHTDLPWAGGRATTGKGVTGAKYRVTPQYGESFVRVILVDDRGRRAWLNPFSV